MDAKKSSAAKMADFKESLNLPRTDFPLRADACINDPIMLERWEKEKLYERAMRCHEGASRFVLHDGPPYANGHIHLGHAYNKILKDILAKARRMSGMQVPLVPGWDCHGLPIEHRVKQENPTLTGTALKAACRESAYTWINIQRSEFKRLGILMDWEHPYITMAPRYEAAILRSFGKLVRGGFVERKNKTVPWCPHCQTALAAAEIEYQDREDPSLFIKFKVTSETAQKLGLTDKPVSFLIWTTTPWTIPLNRAVLLRPGAAYKVIEYNGEYLVLGAERVASVITGRGLGSDLTVKKVIPSEMLAGELLWHPIDFDRQVPVILDQSVGLDEGTACVHCAPGCGPVDYEVGIKNNLEIYSPVTADGRYSVGIVPAELQGKTIAEGQKWVTEYVKKTAMLFAETRIIHSYPHCWRCRKGLIFRATPQWFCNLAHDHVKERALAAIEKIDFMPSQAKNFLRATIESRLEWCLSRQRLWGVPIPALVSGDQTTALITEKLISFVADHVEKEGVEFWDRISLDELVKADVVPADAVAAGYRKETDIIDVWFDSGVSHTAVLLLNPELHFPADLYLEGVDQHRGWFQSSLLTSIILHDEAPMKAIMTHGFTVDDQGRKMSKSLGNVVAPEELIEKVGTDGLRLWVASIGNEGDAVVSKVLIEHVSLVYRKIRNTCRFLLQNLYDFSIERDAVSFEHCSAIDRYALYQLMRLQERVLEVYKQGNVTAIFHLLNDFCTVDMSAFYGDVAKDCLYCNKADSQERRAVQTVFWRILDTLAKLMAPILSFTAEQLSDYYQTDKKESIHLQCFADHAALRRLFAAVDTVAYEKQWALVKEIRSVVLKLIEEQRAAGLVKHSLDAAVDLFIDDMSRLSIIEEKELERFFATVFIVSRVRLIPSPEGLVVTPVAGVLAKVTAASGTRCPRCWQWHEQDCVLCKRCALVVDAD
ncbi:MAG: isoleucine--tRNA ligase [Candidatus Babeliaceae bacterium]|nr:isoleucine--tRNA ligase [Candidatus Babeliaceae bacterium]